MAGTWGEYDDDDFEPNTGWGGGYSRSLGRSFNSEEEYEQALRERNSYGGEPDDDDVDW